MESKDKSIELSVQNEEQGDDELDRIDGQNQDNEFAQTDDHTEGEAPQPTKRLSCLVRIMKYCIFTIFFSHLKRIVRPIKTLIRPISLVQNNQSYVVKYEFYFTRHSYSST